MVGISHNARNGVIGGEFVGQIPSQTGWKARASLAQSKIEARKSPELREGIRLRGFISRRDEARKALNRTEGRVADLRADLIAKQAKAEMLDRWAIQHGRIHPESMSLAFAIQKTAPLIEVAVADLESARERLAIAQQQHDDAMAEANAALATEPAETLDYKPDEAPAEQEPVAPRGRGRPRTETTR